MSLQQEIDGRRAEIRSDSYTMSVGELMGLYINDPPELDIHSEFQRFYRWNIWQKSRLIESLLLGIPMPPIFVSQRSDGIWDVVDGLQRLSAIFEFIGILRDEHGNLRTPLILKGTKYLPSLSGVVWDGSKHMAEEEVLQPVQASSPQEEVSHALTVSQRLLIRRAKVPVNIILEGNVKKTTYDLLLRLNTGGISLSRQVLRNCILLSMNRNMYEWLEQLSHDENFVNCVCLTDNAIVEQYAVELVLRFLVLRSVRSELLKDSGDLDRFLTEVMEGMASSKEFDMKREGEYFRETFALLANSTGCNSFRRYDSVKKEFIGGFLISAFDMIASGIGHNIDTIQKAQINVEGKIKQLWQMREFAENAAPVLM